MKIEEILDKLVGHTDIACETNYDNESGKNLDLLKRVILWATNRLVENSKWYGDYRGSANYLANKSLDIIEEAKEQFENISYKVGEE